MFPLTFFLSVTSKFYMAFQCFFFFEWNVKFCDSTDIIRCQVANNKSPVFVLDFCVFVVELILKKA